MVVLLLLAFRRSTCGGEAHPACAFLQITCAFRVVLVATVSADDPRDLSRHVSLIARRARRVVARLAGFVVVCDGESSDELLVVAGAIEDAGSRVVAYLVREERRHECCS